MLFFQITSVLCLRSIHAEVLRRQQLARAVGARNQPDVFASGELRSSTAKGQRQPALVPVSSEAQETVLGTESDVAGPRRQGLLQN